MFIRTVVNTAHRMVYPFLPVFARGLGVDLSAFSLALTIRSAAGALNPVLGWITDSYGRRTGMLIGIGLFTFGVGLVVVWPIFLVFVFMLVLATFGKYLIDPSMHAYLGDQVPYARRGLAVGLLEMGWSLSFIFGVPIMGFVIARNGWNAPFLIMIGLGIISLLLLVKILPETGSRDVFVRSSGIRHNFSTVLTHVPALAGFGVGFLMSAANEMVNLIFGVWLEDIYGLQIVALGSASLVIGLSELLGESLVSGLTDWLGKRRAVVVGLLLNIMVSFLFPFISDTLYGALIGLFLFYLMFEFSLVSSLSIMTEIVPSARGTVVTLNIASLSLGRAIAALLAVPVYTGGIFANMVVAIGLNFLALGVLHWVRTPQD